MGNGGGEDQTQIESRSIFFLGAGEGDSILWEVKAPGWQRNPDGVRAGEERRKRIQRVFFNYYDFKNIPHYHHYLVSPFLLPKSGAP